MEIPKIIPLSSPISGAVKIGVSTVSELKTIPGIISNVNSLAKISTAEDLLAICPPASLSAFVKETGLTGTFIPPVLFGSESYTQALMAPSFINGFIDAISGSKTVNIQEKVVKVPIGEIHCPNIEGCEATYTEKTQNERDTFIEITIFGFGGGDHKTFSVGSGYKVTAKNQCLRFLKEMKLKFTKKKRKNGKEFTSIEVVEPTDNNYQEIIYDCPTCRKGYNEIKKNKNHKAWHIVADTSITNEIKIDTGTDFNLGIDFSELGIKDKLKISTKVIKEISCEYHLVRGYDYIGYPPIPNSSLFNWTWEQVMNDHLDKNLQPTSNKDKSVIAGA